MISLKKFLDSEGVGSTSADVSGLTCTDTRTESVHLLSACRAALASMGTCGQKAVPVLGSMLGSALARISQTLGQNATPDVIRNVRGHVDEALSLWANEAQENQKQSEQTVRELLLVVFEVTESTEIGTKNSAAKSRS